MEFKVNGVEAREKVVGDGGASGRIYLPKSWIGEKVIIILKEGNE
jgi:putative transposon-encoded protein